MFNELKRPFAFCKKGFVFSIFLSIKTLKSLTFVTKLHNKPQFYGNIHLLYENDFVGKIWNK